MKITVRIKSVYGRERIYPVCEKAKAFAQLIGRKCLNRSHLKFIESFGYEVVIQTPTL